MVSFESAQKALEQGQRVRRKHMHPKKFYVLTTIGRKKYLHSNDLKTGEMIPEVLFWDDTTAKDWEILPITVVDVAA